MADDVAHRKAETKSRPFPYSPLLLVIFFIMYTVHRVCLCVFIIYKLEYRHTTHTITRAYDSIKSFRVSQISSPSGANK